jgi:predicted CoA-binding protein
MPSAHLLTDVPAIDALLARLHRIAVLGIKTEAQAGQPAYDVPRYLDGAGFEIIPVPVYYPEATTILGKPVYRRLVDVPGDLDLVDVFRRAKDLAAHVDDILAKRPRAVWFQLGIRNDVVAERLASEGIDVVQNRCLMVEHRRWAAAAR